MVEPITRLARLVTNLPDGLAHIEPAVGLSWPVLAPTDPP
jgi:hypothetical protein